MEIAQVLRHENLDTTSIYAKVDDVALIEVPHHPEHPAQPRRRATSRRQARQTSSHDLPFPLKEARDTSHAPHTAAMRLIRAGVVPIVISLWLGHESIPSTKAYVHADMTLKERALARTVPLAAKPGRYQAPDPLIAILEAL